MDNIVIFNAFVDAYLVNNTYDKHSQFQRNLTAAGLKVDREQAKGIAYEIIYNGSKSVIKQEESDGQS